VGCPGRIAGVERHDRGGATGPGGRHWEVGGRCRGLRERGCPGSVVAVAELEMATREEFVAHRAPASGDQGQLVASCRADERLHRTGRVP
jgi:hypothetical protein